MTALAKNYARPHKLHERAVNLAPVNAGSKIYVGAYLCREGASGVVVPGADTAGLVPLGVVVESMFPDDPDLARVAAYDNTNGADGTVDGDEGQRAVRYDDAGQYAFVVSAGTPVVDAVAYLVDDNTVSANATTNSIVAGIFKRPAPNGPSGAVFWYVDIARRGLLSGAQSAAVADAETAHALNSTFSDTEVEGALDALGTTVNEIRDALVDAGILRAS
jgi:hypothetical protein